MFTKNGPAKIQFYKMLNLKHKKILSYQMYILNLEKLYTNKYFT